MNGLPRWKIPLQSSPAIIYTGLGRHGPEENSQIYRFAGQWAFHLYRYEGWLHLGGKKYPIHEGTVSLVPPNCAFRHTWIRPKSIHFFSLFRIRSKPKETLMDVPLLSSLDSELNDCFKQLDDSVAGFLTHPGRAEACLWHYLWKIFGRCVPSCTSEDNCPLAVRVCQLEMEKRPLATVKVGELANKAGISHNQLIHLFRQHVGMSPASYLADQRWKHVRTLLQSTTLPLKRIAWDLEFSDLSHFNKFVRIRSGKSPRKFRSEATQSVLGKVN